MGLRHHELPDCTGPTFGPAGFAFFGGVYFKLSSIMATLPILSWLFKGENEYFKHLKCKRAPKTHTHKWTEHFSPANSGGKSVHGELRNLKLQAHEILSQTMGDGENENWRKAGYK